MVAELPTVQGHSEQPGVIKLLLQWWPKGNPGMLHAAGEAWAGLAGEFAVAADHGAAAAQGVLRDNHGQAIDAFAASWAKVDGGDGAFFAAAERTCRDLSAACHDYAHRINAQRSKIERIAAVAGVLSGILTVATFGAGAAPAGGADAAALAAAAAEFAAAVEASEALAVLTEAANVIDAAAAALPEITPVVAETTPASAMDALAAWSAGPFGRGFVTVVAAGTGIGAILEGAASGAPLGPASGYGPIPPSPASPFPVLPAAARADNASWLKTLTPRKEATGTRPEDDYQRQVAGRYEYPVPTGLKDVPGDPTRSRMFADGYRPADGAALEGEVHRHPGQLLTQPEQPLRHSAHQADAAGVDLQTWRSIPLAGQRFEMERYAAAERFDPVHVHQVEVIINKPVLEPYFHYLMDEKHVHGWIRVESAR